MAFGILHAEFAATVVGVLEFADDSATGSLGTSISGIGVSDDDIGASSFDIAEFGRWFESAAVFIVFRRAEHDHATIECEFGMAHSVVGARIDGVALETEDLAQPVDCGVGHPDAPRDAGYGGTLG